MGVIDILNGGTWAVMEAGNPFGAKAPDAYNEKALELLKGILDLRGYAYTDCAGTYGGIKNDGVLIHSISNKTALGLGQIFGQESILVASGLLYQGGKMHLRNSPIDFDDDPGDDYTLVDGVKFSMPIDFSELVSVDL